MLRIILVLNLVILCCGTIKAQDSLVIVNDTVYYKNKAEFICEAKAKTKHPIYFIYSLDKKPQIGLYIVDRDSQIQCSAHFSSLRKRYAVLYPKIDIKVLLESYIKNKVLVNGVLDSTGLIAYCKERNIELLSMDIKKASKPQMNDSVMAARAKADYESQIVFTIENNSTGNIKVKIGSASSNRIVIVKAQEKSEQRARKTEQVCLLDDKNESKSCADVKEGLRSFVVNKDGTTKAE
jgi:hypothetical protein